MTPQTLHVATDPRGVVHVALNTPDRRNVLSPAMIDDLTGLVQDIGRTARAVVLSGMGPVFCAGGDLDWMQAQIRAGRAQRLAEARRLAGMLHALNTMPAPLIGRLHGGAFGGGIGLACVCDVALASDDTRFCFAETRLGLIPATIGPYVLARMGEGRARRVFMSARVFDAAEAERLGIVARAVPAGGLDAAVEAEVAPYLRVAPGAVAAAKRLARDLGPRIDEGVIEDSARRLADIWEGAEAQHGISAFLERRRPDWD